MNDRLTRFFEAVTNLTRQPRPASVSHTFHPSNPQFLQYPCGHKPSNRPTFQSFIPPTRHASNQLSAAPKVGRLDPV